jgi:hypothetical protein
MKKNAKGPGKNQDKIIEALEEAIKSIKTVQKMLEEEYKCYYRNS